MSRRAISFFAGYGALLALLLLAAGLRLAILLHAQTHVHSDEAIVGLMATRILDGRLLPIHMAGQAFNGGAAMEAYLAAGAFALFGPGVVPLKGCIVALSLLTLAAVYAVARRFWGPRAALCAAAVYAVAPTLLKWHFQVRGYGPYLLAVPVLFGLFLVLLETRPATSRLHLAFGLVAGLSLWCMELALPIVLAAAALLVLRRAVSLRQGAAALGGALLGYSPALYFNLTHGFASWKEIAARRLAGAPPPVEPSLLRLVGRFFGVELPRFFGADTVMWYFPERSLTVAVYAVVVLVAILAAAWTARRRIAGFLRDHLLRPGGMHPEDPALYAILFLGACLPPYFLAGFRVPGYLIGAYVFIAWIVGSVLGPMIATRRTASRILGACALATLVLAGLYEAAALYRSPGIETLATDPAGNTRMRRIPGKDIDNTLRHLEGNGIRFVHASGAFQYPIIFESGERIHASAGLFGWKRRLFPEVEAPPATAGGSETILVFESGMPVRRFADLPAGDRVSEHRFGSLTVIRLPG